MQSFRKTCLGALGIIFKLLDYFIIQSSCRIINKSTDRFRNKQVLLTIIIIAFHYKRFFYYKGRCEVILYVNNESTLKFFINFTKTISHKFISITEMIIKFSISVFDNMLSLSYAYVVLNYIFTSKI